jgi:hypothetical protein
VSYPVRIIASKSLLEEWIMDEWASWEDAGMPETPTHVVPILQRMKTRLEVRSQDELELVLKSGEYQGNPSHWGDGRDAHRRAISRLCDRLATRVPKNC